MNAVITSVRHGVQQTRVLRFTAGSLSYNATEREQQSRLSFHRGASAELLLPGGNELLMAAAARQDLPLATLAMCWGADPSMPDNDGELPLPVAAFYGHRTLAAALLAGGAKIGAANSANRTALYVAVASRKYKMAEFLIAAGADVNQPDVAVPAAVAIALRYTELLRSPSREMMQMLLHAKADPNIRDPNGVRARETPLDFTKRARMPLHARLLRDYGGKSGACV